MSTPQLLSIAARAVAAVPGLNLRALTGPQEVGRDVSFTGIETISGELLVAYTSWTGAGATNLARRCSEVDLLSSLPSSALPYAVPTLLGTHTGYENLTAVFTQSPGEPFSPELADSVGGAARLGEAVAAIHCLDPAWVASNVPVYTAAQSRERRLTALDTAAATGRIPAVLLQRWEAALENVSLWQFSPTVVHGNLSAAAFKERDGRIVALEDFGGLHIGDPAQDVCQFTSSVSNYAEDAFLVAYGAGLPGGLPSNLAERATLLGELELMNWLMHGLNNNDADIVADAEEMLAEFAAQFAPPSPVLPADLADAAAHLPAEEADSTDADLPDRQWPAPADEWEQDAADEDYVRAGAAEEAQASHAAFEDSPAEEHYTERRYGDESYDAAHYNEAQDSEDPFDAAPDSESPYGEDYYAGDEVEDLDPEAPTQQMSQVEAQAIAETAVAAAEAEAESGADA
ncbi:MAG: phosphotransferase [Buchananella hordeovulneris]|nr:phosphotransferase [Buchananella hordeovulneris]